MERVLLNFRLQLNHKFLVSTVQFYAHFSKLALWTKNSWCWKLLCCYNSL